jgi:hypothetical protein
VGAGVRMRVGVAVRALASAGVGDEAVVRTTVVRTAATSAMPTAIKIFNEFGTSPRPAPRR